MQNCHFWNAKLPLLERKTATFGNHPNLSWNLIGFQLCIWKHIIRLSSATYLAIESPFSSLSFLPWGGIEGGFWDGWVGLLLFSWLQEVTWMTDMMPDFFFHCLHKCEKFVFLQSNLCGWCRKRNALQEYVFAPAAPPKGGHKQNTKLNKNTGNKKQTFSRNIEQWMECAVHLRNSSKKSRGSALSSKNGKKNWSINLKEGKPLVQHT